MNLDKLQVNACIRSGWQAIDLGMLMARAWWGKLFLASLLPMLPLALVLLAVCHDNPLWAWFWIWWLKPFWERLPLFIASRLLFGESINLWDGIRALPLRDALPWLLWRRLSFQRAFDNPVTVLEGLKGATRRQRLRVLHGKYSDVAISNQLVGFFCEWIIALGLLVLFQFFIPDSMNYEFYDQYEEISLAGEWALTLAAFGGMVLVMPFHCMAGFALYLNRRIELEAWDIEISFRNLASRHQREAKPLLKTPTLMLPLGMLLAGLMLATTPDLALAQTSHDRESAKTLIDEVLDGKDYGEERTVTSWRFKDWTNEEEAPETIPEWFIDFIEFLFSTRDWWTALEGAAFWIKILLVIAFGALLFYLFRRFQGPLSRALGRVERETPPEVLFGLDVTPESLPDDVPGQVLNLWQQGAGREALSLLYRATLSRLIDRHEIAFRSSHTEAECAALVRARGIDSLSDYFTDLTRVWRRLAYGHHLPLAETVDDLCQGWKRELADESH